MSESKFEKDTISELRELYPGIVIIKNYAGYIQAIPDRILLFEDHWAALEFKEDINSPARPNQPYYIALLNQMSYASFIYPQNKEQVFHELQQAFRTPRPSRLFVSK